MNRYSAALAAALTALAIPSTQSRSAAAEQPSRNAVEKRVDQLFARLTEREKLSLLSGTGFTTQPIPRLGIPAMGMVDGPRGIRAGVDANAGPATQFLEPIAMAATWDPSLISTVGAALGEEAQNKGVGAQILLGPCVNIERSPLWGRAGESFGEDPWLASRMAVGYIEGVQSTGDAACIKHYACNNEEVDRDSVDTLVDERALREIYLPAFHAGVAEGHAWTLMAAYNLINGYHATANRYLLTDILRHEWGFDGVAMSDWGAVHETAAVVNAGLDLEMPGGQFLTEANLAKALREGRISQAEIDAADRRILRTIVRTGLMDGPRKPNHAIVDSARHRQINLDAASEAMVLLKNDNGALPLERRQLRSIAVIGPLGDAPNSGIGGSSYVAATHFVTPFAGIKQSAGQSITVTATAGCGIEGPAEPLTNIIPPSVFTPARPDATVHGLTGEYFANQDLNGTPTLVRTDPAIDFQWSTISPAPSIPREHFSARWTGTLTAPLTGRYELGVNADDGVRVSIDGKPVIDRWADGGAERTLTGNVDLVAGRSYPIKIEYYQDGGDASVRLAWIKPGEPVPGIPDAVQAASTADAAVVFVGTEGTEGEGFDRSSMDLPGDQAKLIEAVAAVNKRTIVVVSSGGPTAMSGWIDKVPAVIQSWNAGQETGSAIAAILFGDVNPSGKLPTTFGMRREDYPDYGHFPGSHGRVRYAEGIYVGYRHFDKAGIAPLFPFGYGLSYTTFQYRNLRLSSDRLTPTGSIKIAVDIVNTGRRTGKEVVQLYLHDPAPKIDKAVRELKGFEKVELTPGQTKTVEFTLHPDALAYVDAAHKCWRADAGEYEAQIGASSRDIRLRGEFRLTADYVDRVSDMGNGPVVLDEGYAAGRPATASTTQNDLVPANAVDGDPSTRWGSTFSDPQWLAVDLGKVRTIARVHLLWEDAYARAYQIQVSTDGKRWRTVFSRADGRGGSEEARFAPVAARWVRLFCTKRATQWGDSVYSFGVYGK